MLNLEQWKKDANARKELEELLRHPTMANALAIITQQALEHEDPPSGVDITQWGAMKGFKREGFFDAFDKLRALAKVTPLQSKISAQDAWKINPKSMPEEKFIDSETPLDNPLPAKEEKSNPEPTL